MLTLFEQALVMHLIGDWILQNHWMTENKPNLKHPAAYIHSAIHTGLLAIVLGWKGALVIGVLHMIIDTRSPFRWWRRIFKMTTDGPVALHVAIWTDQVMHVLCIAGYLHFVAPVI